MLFLFVLVRHVRCQVLLSFSILHPLSASFSFSLPVFCFYCGFRNEFASHVDLFSFFDTLSVFLSSFQVFATSLNTVSLCLSRLKVFREHQTTWLISVSFLPVTRFKSSKNPASNKNEQVYMSLPRARYWQSCVSFSSCADVGCADTWRTINSQQHCLQWLTWMMRLTVFAWYSWAGNVECDGHWIGAGRGTGVIDAGRKSTCLRDRLSNPHVAPGRKIHTTCAFTPQTLSLQH